MVKAELNYNPYLLETKIIFNDHEPKINSSVEKYIALKLQDWIEDLPNIFYNEMNGWDFELDFSGTEIDFEYITKAFNSKQVTLFHRSTIEGSKRKSEEISRLLQWFENNPNRKFKFSAFKQENSELFYSEYPFVIFQGNIQNTISEEITVENISDIDELGKDNLENTPVLFYINEENLNEFKNNIRNLLKRSDINQSQLFFCINENLDNPQIERIIKDTGIKTPKLVKSPEEEIIRKYFEVYPITDYIAKSIIVFRSVQENIKTILDIENEKSIVENSDIRAKISNYENTLKKLKNSSGKISERENFNPPDGFVSAKSHFNAEIQNFKKKKIKITNDEEAERTSYEFSNEIKNYFSQFKEEIKDVIRKSANNISANFFNIYNEAEYNDSYKINEKVNIEFSEFILPAFENEFLVLKKEEMVDKKDFLDGAFKIFGNKSTGERELIRQVEYSYSNWRDRAIILCTPVIDEIISKSKETLNDYYETIAKNYLEHLTALIDEQTKLKEEVSEKLSDDERELQKDKDWFSEFSEKLNEIERS